MAAHRPSLRQEVNRYQHVLPEPYRSGERSSQRQPVERTYRMPFSVLRSSARGRPVCAGVGMSGARSDHSLSLRSEGRGLNEDMSKNEANNAPAP